MFVFKELKDGDFGSVGVADRFVEPKDCVDGARRSLASGVPGDMVPAPFIVTGEDGGSGVAEALFKERRSIVADSDDVVPLFVDLDGGKEGTARSRILSSSICNSCFEH